MDTNSILDTEVDIKSPGNAKKRVQRRADPYLLKKMLLLCIFMLEGDYEGRFN